MIISLSRRAFAEFLGTAFLVMAVVGSGIMAERLAGGNAALALLANTIATGAALVALILTFGPVSGAHLNPVVSVMETLMGGLPRAEAAGYVSAQVFGGVIGAAVVNLMFEMPLVSVSHHARNGPGQILAEFVATFGLMCVIWSSSRLRPNAVAFAVGAYITAAYWFTSSTSFANPAVTIARCLSDTFAGIRPQDVPPFVIAQFLGAVSAVLLLRWILPRFVEKATDVVPIHDSKISV